MSERSEIAKSERSEIANRIVQELNSWGWNASHSLAAVRNGHGKFRNISFNEEYLGSDSSIEGCIELYSEYFTVLKINAPVSITQDYEGHWQDCMMELADARDAVAEERKERDALLFVNKEDVPQVLADAHGDTGISMEPEETHILRANFEEGYMYLSLQLNVDNAPIISVGMNGEQPTMIDPEDIDRMITTLHRAKELMNVA